MLDLEKRKSIDLLVEQFWKQGYLSIKRKFGRYLPEPEKIGSFDVDVVARCKKDYAIGITIFVEDIKDPRFLEKISYLATRQTKFTNQKVLLFIGIPSQLFKTVKVLIESLEPAVRKNIRPFQIIDKSPVTTKKSSRREYLFS